MKSSLISSTSASGITPSRWNSFSQVATATYAPLTASFTPVNLQVIDQNASVPQGTAYPNKYASYGYRFSVAAGALPDWVQPGTPLKIAASVTLPNNAVTPVNESITVSDFYVVVALDPNGTYFDVNAPRPHGGGDAASITQLVAQTALDSGSGNIPAPLVTLVMQAQKAMFSATTGTVVLAPSVDHSGNAPYSVTLVNANPNPEYEITAPAGSKYDLADYQVKFLGIGTLAVRFV